MGTPIYLAFDLQFTENSIGGSSVAITHEAIAKESEQMENQRSSGSKSKKHPLDHWSKTEACLIKSVLPCQPSACHFSHPLASGSFPLHSSQLGAVPPAAVPGSLWGIQSNITTVVSSLSLRVMQALFALGFSV